MPAKSPMVRIRAAAPACLGTPRVLHRRTMPPTYVALPHPIASAGWMVFNRVRCHPVAADLPRLQARTLARALNLAEMAAAERS